MKDAPVELFWALNGLAQATCRWMVLCLTAALSAHFLSADLLDTAEVRFPLPPYESQFRSMAIGEGVIVAIAGSTNSVFVSTDRVTWTSIPISKSFDLRSIAYGNGRFVIVGGTYCIWSEDGYNWSEALWGRLADAVFVTFTRGKFWAVGGSYIMDSEDGVSWRYADFGSDFESIYHTNYAGLFSLFDDGVKLHAKGIFQPTLSKRFTRFESLDGETWSFRYNDNTALGKAVDFATDGSTIAVVAGSPPSLLLDYRWQLYVQEPDGLTRRLDSPFGDGARWTGVEYRDGRFFFFCGHGIASTDSDFATWKIEPFASDYGLMDIQGDDDGWLAATQSGHLLFRSYDAAALDPWEVLYSKPDRPTLDDIAFGNGLFLVLDRDQRLIRSVSGSNWTYLPGTFESADDLVFAWDRFLLLDYDGEPLQSADGSDWSELEIDPAAQIFSVAAGPDLWIALSRIETDGPISVYLSPDGIAWEKQNVAIPTNTQSITYGNGIFVSENLVTPDGITWEGHLWVENIRFSEGEFLGHDYRDYYRSSNAIDWTKVSGSNEIEITATLKLGGNHYVLTDDYDPVFPSGVSSSRYSYMESGWGTIVILGGGLIAQTVSIFPPSQLANLSARTLSGAGAATQIAGFVIGGSDPTRILARGIGPSLSAFNVGNPIADPMLTLIGEAGEIARNDNWADESQTEKEAAFTEVGAFQVAPGSLDAALVEELDPGKYTAHVINQAAGTGVALAEIYQLGTELPLKNLSCRTYVDSGEEAAIGGLVVSGSGIALFLVRAVGPGLAAYGVEGVLSDPVLQIHRGSTLIATNQGWDDPSQTQLFETVSETVGAFPLVPGSADSALVIDLPPGNYTASVSGANESAGIALLEIYLVE